MLYKIETPEDIGGIIKSTRQEKKLTQFELFEMANVENHTISRIERGGYCTMATALELCKALGITMYLEKED